MPQLLPPRSQARQNGPRRGPHGPPAFSSNPNSAISHRNDLQHNALSLAAGSDHDRAIAPTEYQYHHERSKNDVDPDVNCNSQYSGEYKRTNEEHPHYQTVARTRQFIHPEVLCALNDPRLKGLENISTHGRSIHHGPSQTRSRLPQPAWNEHHLQQTHDGSRPLGYSNLRELNLQRSPASAMDHRFWLRQCDEPYDAVGNVGWQSDYERRQK